MVKGNIIVLVIFLAIVSATIGYFSFSREEVVSPRVSVEVTETAPSELNDPDIGDTGKVWLELIRDAGTTIDIEVPYLGSADQPWILDNIYNELVEAADRGVSVRILIESSKFGDEMVGELRRHDNVEILPWDSAYLHSKYIIVDGEVVSVGSANMSYPALAIRGAANREINLTLRGERIAETYTYIFETGWAEAGGGSTGAELVWAENWLVPVADGVEGVTSTVDAYIWLFDRAEENVYFYMYIYAGAPPELAAAIEGAIERGVTIRALVDRRSEADYPRELEDLRERGVEVRVMHITKAAHPKLIISDEGWAYVGSANIHPIWMLSGREVGVLVNSPDVIEDLLDIFWTDWLSSRGLGT